MMGLDDERSKKMAEVMGNPTCKKILDYLADTNEASQKDISDALNIPMNTLDYNIKKLLDVGLIEKTKNFFWSAKGKKIPMYKLARKHIVISPKSTKPSIIALKTIIPVIIAVAFVFILIGLIPEKQSVQPTNVKSFDSIDDIKSYIEKNKLRDDVWSDFEAAAGVSVTKSTTAEAAGGAGDYSTTNIQVEGVDEADIIKNDGKYIYTVVGNKVVIVNAYPADNMEILSEINFSGNSEGVGEVFINDDKLIIFTISYSPIIYAQERTAKTAEIAIYPPRYQESKTNVYIYDISDREKPELENKISVSGNYINSRMIENYVYLITNQYMYDEEIILPMIEKNGEVDVIQPNEISYIDDIEDRNYMLTIITSIDVNDGDTTKETILSGYTGNVYVSMNNIYLTQTQYSSWYTGEGEKTIIQKISIDEDNVKYVASGEVKGHILNQFSMDEFDENFRIATSGSLWESGESISKNNVYILDENLNIIGKLEDLAPGEKIYSVRFIGERAYMVTFKKVDPLFVIDLSNPQSPSILGKLKIPGYSDYLHPYDENHIIGIGKEAADASSEDVNSRNLDFAWYQGMKIAIFDVSDVENPVELHKIVIGDRGTDSEALHEHKAFLFNREKELLVLPITLAEYKEPPTEPWQYGEFTFQGAYVYKINLDEGFKFKGRITHVTEQDELKRGYYYDWYTQIKRSLYIGDILYTVSNKIIKANDLDDLTEINKVELPHEEQKYYYGNDGI